MVCYAWYAAYASNAYCGASYGAITVLIAVMVLITVLYLRYDLVFSAANEFLSARAKKQQNSLFLGGNSNRIVDGWAEKPRNVDYPVPYKKSPDRR